jgi:phosphomannomutase
LTDNAVQFYNSRGDSTRLPGWSTVLTPLHDERSYLCPGEAAPVGRAVHLARLAASYEKCAVCSHRRDVNLFLSPAVSAPVDPPQVRTQTLVSVSHGFRGRYGDPLDRALAMKWAAALASLLWEERIDTTVQPQEAVVVVGYDERLCSPDLLTGIMRGVERMSCRVFDIGLTTEPCLRFAVQQLDVDAGLIVTGAGCDPAWSGFDVFRRLGLPPEQAFLDRWQAASIGLISRPSRSPGHVVAHSISQQYDAALAGRFHAVRPLTIVCGAASRQLRTRIENLLARLPGRMQLETVPVRRRDLSDRRDPDHLRIGQRVCDRGADLGVVMGDDGTKCSFLDERGELIDAVAWQLRIIDRLLRDDPQGTIILDTHAWDQLAPHVTSAGGKPILVASSDRAARMMFESGLAAFGGDHRVWFGGEIPTCDAIATLAAVWQALSRSDAPASEALR